ncbi:hypothetical protein DOY81_008422, partial [Sarcophaga bullata]
RPPVTRTSTLNTHRLFAQLGLSQNNSKQTANTLGKVLKFN